MLKSPILWFFLLLAGIALFTAVSPVERTLGANARIVYLHGAWVWAALFAFITAGGVGFVGLMARRDRLHRWSRALGRTGLFFWITYLPISMWAMQSNWNGLFLEEPRWRVALIFAIGGLLLQIGLTLLEKPAWASLINLSYIVALLVILQNTEKVMHPPAPMLESNAWRIQIFFIGLTILALLAAWQVTRWWHRFEQDGLQPETR
jgi:hypothetical protein